MLRRRNACSTELDTQIKVINADDEIGHQWLTELPDAIAVSMNADFKVGSHQWMKAINIHYHFKRCRYCFLNLAGVIVFCIAH